MCRVGWLSCSILWSVEELRRRGGAAGSLIWLLRDIMMFLAGGGDGRVGIAGKAVSWKRRNETSEKRTTTIPWKRRTEEHPPVPPSSSPSWHHWHFPSLTSGKFFNRLRMTQPDQTQPVMWWENVKRMEDRTCQSWAHIVGPTSRCYCR